MADGRSRVRDRVHEIVFEADTPSGRVFDLALLVAIVLSIVVVMLDTVAPIVRAYGRELYAAEWAFTLLFTVEYGLRLFAVRRPAKYARSFYGIIDLVAILPTYLSVVFEGAELLLAVRALRLLRVFRVLKLGHYLGAADVLLTALRASRLKITVFLFTVLVTIVVIGALMFVIEGPGHGFTSMPVSVYWTVVTLTTTGFGDITPQTPLGRLLAAVVMLFGYGLLAVPTGIVSAELARAQVLTTQACLDCGRIGHDPEARFCKFCGGRVE